MSTILTFRFFSFLLTRLVTGNFPFSWTSYSIMTVLVRLFFGLLRFVWAVVLCLAVDVLEVVLLADREDVPLDVVGMSSKFNWPPLDPDVEGSSAPLWLKDDLTLLNDLILSWLSSAARCGGRGTLFATLLNMWFTSVNIFSQLAHIHCSAGTCNFFKWFKVN